MGRWEEILFKINSKTIISLAEKWNADKDSLKLISKGINLVYSFESNHEIKYLRISHECIRSVQDLEAALAFQNHLFQNTVSVCSPLKSIHCNFVESIRENEGLFLATVCSEAKGNPIDVRKIPDEVLLQWGKELARLHLSSSKYINENNFKYLNVFDLLEESKQYLACESTKILKVFWELEIWLKNLNQNKNNYGLTHGDHREANVIFDGQKITFIDFDEPVYNFYLEDIARPFMHFYENTTHVNAKFTPFIKGYSLLKEIDYSNENIYNFVRLKSLKMYLWTKNNWSKKSVPGGANQVLWLESLLKIVGLSNSTKPI